VAESSDAVDPPDPIGTPALPARLAELLQLSVGELRLRFVESGLEIPRGVLPALREDPRAGVRALATILDKRRAARQAEERRITRLTLFEREHWDQGLELVGGVDEVGMAPLAGPVITAAVILRRGARIQGVNDSKQLSAEEREALAPLIKEQAVCWAIGEASVEEIDRLNIYQAGLLALKRAVMNLRPLPQHLLVDARRIDVPMPQTPIIQGDAKSLTLGAASIVAKVHRDQLMSEMDLKYPGYGLGQHKGYPTPVHLEALDRLGPCEIHRRSFGPVQRALGLDAASKQRPLF
jgi:ribonuclease HII